MVIIGNKTDKEERSVSAEDAQSLAKKLGLSYMEGSAKTGETVPEMFKLICGLLPSEAAKDVGPQDGLVNLNKSMKTPETTENCRC